MRESIVVYQSCILTVCYVTLISIVVGMLGGLMDTGDLAQSLVTVPRLVDVSSDMRVPGKSCVEAISPFALTFPWLKSHWTSCGDRPLRTLEYY